MVLEKNDISKDDVLVGNPTFYTSLYDYNYLYYLVLYERFQDGESFEEIVDYFDIKTFLYDKRWLTMYDVDE